MEIRKFAYAITFLALLSTTVLFAQADSTEHKASFFKDMVFYQLSFGVMAHESEFSGTTYQPSANAAIGYKWRRYFQPGISIGVDGFQSFTTLPVGLLLMGQVKNTRKTPIYFVRAGRALPTKSETGRYEKIKGGYFYELGAGYEWGFEQSVFQLKVSWKRQQMTTQTRRYDYFFDDIASTSFLGGGTPQTKTAWTMQRVVLSMGIRF